MDKKQGYYKLKDETHNAWECEICGYITSFEADGPMENGWNVCPVCAVPIVIKEEE